MEHFVNIYRNKADSYHRMIAAEDVEQHLPELLNDLLPKHAKNYLDIGGGTGRIPLLLHEKAEELLSLDLHRDMLREQEQQMGRLNNGWQIAQADLRELPVGHEWADVVSAAWAIGHFQSWHGDLWRKEVERAMREMERTCKPEGLLVIMETLGTGVESPGPPSPGLSAYYDLLEKEFGFNREEISTDYEFKDIQEAADLIGFFFGAELADKVIENNWVRVPEWTGVWWKRVIR